MNEICHLQGGFPGALFDLTPSDWAWRGIRGGLFKLHPDWAMGGKTGKFDAVQMLSYDISIKDPDRFTQRRYIYATAGSVDRHGNRRTDYVFEGKSICVPDPERYGGNYFNQKYGDCLTLEACNDLWISEHGAAGGPTCPPIEPQPYFPPRRTLDGKRRWCHAFQKVLSVPDYTGRTFIWGYETAGNFDKSAYTGYEGVMSCALEIAVTGTDADMFNHIENHIAEYDYAPEKVFLDCPRGLDPDKFPWTAAETIKNGAAANVKWKVRTHRFARPHLVVFANIGPHDFVHTKMSADRVVAVELRAFEAALAGGATPPTNITELMAFPTVELFD